MLVFLIKNIIYISVLATNVFANNASYVALSNQIAKNNKMIMITNNLANTTTVGYVENDIVYKNFDVKNRVGKKIDSFVSVDAQYLTKTPASFKNTGNNLDIAITRNDNAYFKILTPNGARYTLDGSMKISADRTLVNAHGFPYANIDDNPILLPEDFRSISVSHDGTISSDTELVDQIGVFELPPNRNIRREGSGLLYSDAEGVRIDTPSILSGFLRESSVRGAKAMYDLVEAEQSNKASNVVMTDILSMERKAIGIINLR